MEKFLHCDVSLIVNRNDLTGRGNLQITAAGQQRHGRNRPNFLYFPENREVNEKCASLPQALRSEVLKDNYE